MTKEERKIYNHNNYEQNKERRSERNKATHKKWAEKNKEHIAEYQREYKKKNAERLRKYKREYQRAHYISKTKASEIRRKFELAEVLIAHGYSVSMEEE